MFPVPDDRFNQGLAVIGNQYSKSGYQCIPMVTKDHLARCALDILLLRPEETRFICNQGDIDGQVKTIFDVLRLPHTLEEAGGSGPQADEIPFFCLLEDDRLISEVRVTADQLLQLPNSREVRANDAFVVIHVSINAKYSGTMGVAKMNLILSAEPELTHARFSTNLDLSASAPRQTSEMTAWRSSNAADSSSRRGVVCQTEPAGLKSRAG
ncbi:MAG TPA: hypothetical protein VMJ75_10290 [Candidatus Acidoferrales bacterium]|nr:hypothetical protein [Candidatus Acidoferrales bacterium]